MNYREKLDSLNTLIKTAIKYNNKFYKLAIKICYNKVSSKIRPYFGYINNCGRQI